MRFVTGKKLAENLLAATKEKLKQLHEQATLVVVLIGDDKPSHTYVALKHRAAEQLGIGFRVIMLPKDTSQEDALALIRQLNDDQEVTGILVQLPLPEHLVSYVIIDAIHPLKDVDGFHRENTDAFLLGKPCLVPVFSRAILEMMRFSGVSLSGKQAVALVNSDSFGKIMVKQLEKNGIPARYLLQKSLRQEDFSVIHEAGIVITACGIPHLLNRTSVNDNALVIDGGITVIDGHVVGDFSIDGAEQTNLVITPVPGGVGPVTIACLLENVVEAKRMQMATAKIMGVA